MGVRRKGRILAFQALYSWDISQGDDSRVRAFEWLEGEEEEEAVSFARLILAGTLENVDSIDEILQEHMENWQLDRVSRVDLAILRLSVYSLLHQSDIPARVTINEAIEIAKQFGSDESYRFVNGVLDAVRKNALS